MKNYRQIPWVTLLDISSVASSASSTLRTVPAFGEPLGEEGPALEQNQ